MFEVMKTLLLPASHEIGVAQSGIIIFATIALGLLVGKLKYKGISLGISAIMFSGILFGHLGYHINPEVSEFLRDLGLILFVYAIGIQVWPYFFSSFKNDGLKFNILAVSTVLMGGLITLGLKLWSGISIDNMVGIMSGAVTNTPGLGAAKSVLADIAAITHMTFTDPTNGYALTYPFGVLGVIILMVLGKLLMRVDLDKEHTKFVEKAEQENPSPKSVVCRVTNTNMFGKTIKEVMHLIGHATVHITRIKRSGSNEVALVDKHTILMERDVVIIVGKQEQVDYAVNLLGRLSSDTTIKESATTHSQSFMITNKALQFQSIAQLHVYEMYHVRITRIIRGEIEFVATPSTVLMIGDRIMVVGNDPELKVFEQYVGNAEKKLHEPELFTICIGIILWVIVGSLPISVSGLSYPLKLWMAAGPLIVALLISKYSIKLKISPYIHKSALLMVKDLGIALFFAVVGLKAGATFYSTLIEYNGFSWILYGLIITIVPLLVMMLFGYYYLKINFLQLVGLMAASYTDPAALAFGSSYFKSDIPNQSYATVYPLVTIMRIIVAQVLVLLMVG